MKRDMLDANLDAPDVVVVEDDPRQCIEFVEFFRRLGVRYRTFNDGREALEALDRLAPRIALLDIRLPGADGIEIARAILKRREHPVVILMSGHMDAVYEANRSAARDLRVIEKPVDLRVMARFIRDVMKSP